MSHRIVIASGLWLSLTACAVGELRVSPHEQDGAGPTDLLPGDAAPPADLAARDTDPAGDRDLAVADGGDRPDATARDLAPPDGGGPPADLGLADQGPADAGHPPHDGGPPDAGGPADGGPPDPPDAGQPGEDAGGPLVPETCGFAYDDLFLPPPSVRPLPSAPGAPRPAPPDLDPTPRPVAHLEPAPPGYSLRELPGGDGRRLSLVMPDYDDALPLFERARPFAGATRCYETPTGARQLTEAQAYDLIRSVAESTTGVSFQEAGSRRTVVGLRGAYPGTFDWNGNTPDRFNDTIVLLWREAWGEKRVLEFPVNTDTGAHEFGIDSSSSLRPNRRYHYINGWHRGYNALSNAEWGYRVRDDANANGHWDSDRNGWLPPFDETDRDRTGSAHNIHMGAVDRPLGEARVDGWSAGCQVIPGRANWDAFIGAFWTGEGDAVDYHLVDARDIPAGVWGPCPPDGSHRCPFPVTALPFTDRRDTSRAGFYAFEQYNCSPANEAGRELVYVLTLDTSGTLDVTVDCEAPVDIDVHLLDGDDARACLARGHTGLRLAVGPGRYWIVADTFVDGQGTPLAGPYELRIRLD